MKASKWFDTDSGVPNRFDTVHSMVQYPNSNISVVVVTDRDVETVRSYWERYPIVPSRVFATKEEERCDI